MNDYQGIEIVNRFFFGTGATYDHIVNLCTLEFDRWWKRKILERIPHGPARIMDQACGTGILTFKIAEKFPDCQITGIDISEEYLGIAKEKARHLGVANVEFMLGRAEEVLLDQTFDCITSSYLAKYADLGALILRIRKMLREGGTLIMHDFIYPSNQAFARIWGAYFKLLQTAGAFLYPQWKEAFYGLPGLLRETQWVCELVSLLQDNQFSEISTQYLSLGSSAIVAAKKGQV